MWYTDNSTTNNGREEQVRGILHFFVLTHFHRSSIRLAAAAENLKKAEGPRKLYVGSLHYNINEEMLRAVFEPFGQVENVLISRDTDTGISRGYGFIQVSKYCDTIFRIILMILC